MRALVECNRKIRQLAAIFLAACLILPGSAAASEAQALADDALYVEVSGDLVTLRADRVSIRSLLEEVASRIDMQLVMFAPLEETVSVEFEQRTMPDAIRSVLRHRNFALQYGSSRPNVLWVFSGSTAGEEEFDVVIDKTGIPAPENAVVMAGRDLANADTAVRLKAVLTLADARDEQVTDALAAALVDADAGVREEAVDALAGTGGPAALGLIEFALMDPDRAVRETAIEAIAEVGGDEAAGALAPLLNDADVGLRTDAVDALGEIGGATAKELLRQALMDEASDIREIAAGYLATLSSPGE